MCVRPRASATLIASSARLAATELQLVGAYASNGPDFPDAIALAQQAPLAGFVDAVYPLARWREAIGHASAAGRLGTIKVAFDPQKD